MTGKDANGPAERDHTPASDPDSAQITLRPPRSVPPARGVSWIVDAFALFRQFPVPWVTTGLIFLGLSLIFSLIPAVGGVINTVVSTLVLSGVMLGCAAQEMGEDYDLNFLFVGFSRAPKLITLSLLYVGITYLILTATLGSFGLSVATGTVDPETLNAQLAEHSSSMLLAFVLLVPVFMATRFAVVLITLHDVTVVSALKLSFQATLVNILPVLVFSAVFGILLMISVLPMFLGLLVTYPMLLISNYTAYRDLFTHEQVKTK